MNIIISDCDHADIAIEKSVFANVGMTVQLQQNKTAQEVIDNCQQAEVIINQYAPFTAEVFAQLPHLKMIVRYGVGVNNIDLDEATKHHVQVCNIPDYGTQEVADHALALMLTLVRKTSLMTSHVKKGEWNYQKSIPIRRLADQTIGIIGVGRIGSAFAEKVKPLGSRIIAWDPSAEAKKRKFDSQFIDFVSFEKVVEESDIISIHSPLDGAEYLFNKEVLLKMKKEAYIVNVSRGGIIDEEALYEVMRAGHIAGAALDVLQSEPISKNNKLLQLENLLITPHMAWYSEQSGQELKRKVAEESIRFITGQKLEYPVNNL
ncbi:C-terminal binding protein [Kurthia sibirica]|uniref:C-terminal binding protein n=1 Tax=Kurthia sibirica TaxID=202750 RepID=A0A2U3AI12_9BACL|nr:C-terminal binding protein [Kurthia sibirica]PWI24196.1 C-terminal binding protein [Kurthia sibirica]GEK34816.1 dehydrogenase [Kurthia sibirica]